jgi:hypothetical protein
MPELIARHTKTDAPRRVARDDAISLLALRDPSTPIGTVRAGDSKPPTAAFLFAWARVAETPHVTARAPGLMLLPGR